MELMFGALGIYVLGVCCLLWPERWERGAHVLGNLLSAAASFLVFIFAADSLLGWGILPPSALAPVFAWGQFSLQVDFWSGAFLALTGFSGASMPWVMRLTTRGGA